MMVDDTIRDLLAKHGRLKVDANRLGATDDLYRSGLTSHASVNLMLALEDEFDVEFAERLLRRSTFESIERIRSALHELGVVEPETE